MKIITRDGRRFTTPAANIDPINRWVKFSSNGHNFLIPFENIAAIVFPEMEGGIERKKECANNEARSISSES